MPIAYMPYLLSKGVVILTAVRKSMQRRSVGYAWYYSYTGGGYSAIGLILRLKEAVPTNALDVVYQPHDSISFEIFSFE